MSEVKHTPWEVGQHPAVSNGWIVRPIMLGSNVCVLPAHEGGHVMFLDEAVAHKVAAADDMLAALKAASERLNTMATLTGYRSDDEWVQAAQKQIDDAIAKAEGRQ